MIMKSKIKALFDEKLRRQIAAICDTRRIESNQEKMDLLQRLLYSADIQVDQLGGATNRFVGMIDGYAVKFAVDRQGYKDNLMEYALSSEMQPYVTKSYETNGYILVQECVRILTIEEWRVRKTEVLKILDILGREYLLGDVGYFDVNMTNWGLRDNGELVILDYAYCHRLTEDLFTCSVCGALLTYDQNFVNILCTDRANCHEKYSYNQIKARQGDAVDWQMIEEKKQNSVAVPAGKDSVSVERDSDLLLDSRTFVIRSYRDLALYKEVVENMVTLDYTDQELLEKMRRLTKAKIVGDTEEIALLEAEIHDKEKEIEKVRCIIDPEFQQRMDDDAMAEHEAMLYGYDYDPSVERNPVKKEAEEDLSKYSFEALMERLRNSTKETNNQVEEISEDEDTSSCDPEVEEDSKSAIDDFEGDSIDVMPVEEETTKELEESLSDNDDFTDEPVLYTEKDEQDCNIEDASEPDDGETPIEYSVVAVGDEIKDDPEEIVFDGVSLDDDDDIADGEEMEENINEE